MYARGHGAAFPDQRRRLLGGGQVRLDQDVGVPVVDVLAGVADLAHADLLVHPGVAHQRVASVPSALSLMTGTLAWAASFLNRLDT
jgi:hypothetical protein